MVNTITARVTAERRGETRARGHVPYPGAAMCRHGVVWPARRLLYQFPWRAFIILLRTPPTFTVPLDYAPRTPSTRLPVLSHRLRLHGSLARRARRPSRPHARRAPCSQSIGPQSSSMASRAAFAAASASAASSGGTSWCFLSEASQTHEISSSIGLSLDGSCCE